jgi:hypothetical protein
VADHPGIVYAIENTAWPGWIKVGRAEGPERDAEGVLRRRLYQYNTGDPFRGYLVVAQAFASCCHDAERFAHAFLEIRCRRGHGEWFACLPSTAETLLLQACLLARQAPQVRGEQFTGVITEMRDNALADTDTALLEHTKSPGLRRVEVVETAQAAKQVILGLLDQQAMPDDLMERAAGDAIRRLESLEGIA